MQALRGIAVSPGLAIGPALVIDPRGLRLPARAIAAEAVTAELERLDRGLAEARQEAESAEAEARQRLGPQYAGILAAHAQMIADPTLRQGLRARVEHDRIAAEHAVADLLDDYAARLEGLDAPHLAARAADVRDIENRIIDRLSGPTAPSPLADAPEPSVALAHDLSPSETAGLDPARILGFATEAGGRASHTAIVAAALEIPAVAGLGPFLARARRCRTVIVDGDEGLVILDPDAATLRRYRKASAERAARFAGLARLADLPAETRDGVRVRLEGNIEFPGEVAACRERGADGIGLYRTEFLYLNAERPPTEAEQFAAYEAVVRSMQGRPVTIRTLDLGADKLVPYQGGEVPPARNPFLGLRSIRLSLRDPSLFRTQLRAILRASALGDVRVMFPLISTLGEFRRARAILDEVASDLIGEGVPVRADLPVGAMIEVPAAAVTAESLAKEVDFFSIGTNDLIQYALAVDRTDETVADLYNAADPAVLRLIAMVVEAASARGREVTVCGTMGGEPLYAPLLLGLGLRQLSMPPHQLPEVKRIVRAISLADAQAVAAEAMRLDTAEAVAALLDDALRRAVPDAAVPAGPLTRGTLCGDNS
jgi:phosphotransferase system enzyme I (PtsI)